MPRNIRDACRSVLDANFTQLVGVSPGNESAYRNEISRLADQINLPRPRMIYNENSGILNVSWPGGADASL